MKGSSIIAITKEMLRVKLNLPEDIEIDHVEYDHKKDIIEFHCAGDLSAHNNILYSKSEGQEKVQIAPKVKPVHYYEYD